MQRVQNKRMGEEAERGGVAPVAAAVLATGHKFAPEGARELLGAAGVPATCGRWWVVNCFGSGGARKAGEEENTHAR